MKKTFSSVLQMIMSKEYLDVSIYEINKMLYQNSDNRKIINRWINEKVRPEKESIEQIAKVLRLPFEMEYYLTGLAGYIPPIGHRTKQQVQDLFRKYLFTTDQTCLPKYVLDAISFKFFVVNSGVVRLIGGEEKLSDIINCSVFTLLFSKKYGFMDLYGGDLEVAQREQIRRYQVINRMRWHEQYFMEYPERLRTKDGLSPEEYTVFEKQWKDVEAALYKDLLTSKSSTIDVNPEIELTFRIGDNRDYLIALRLRPVQFYEPGPGSYFLISETHLADAKDEEKAKWFCEDGTPEWIEVWKHPHFDSNEFFAE